MRLPRSFGRYRLVEKVAIGGTAEIYRAILSTSDGFAKTVAIKTLLPSLVCDDELSKLLVDEAKVLCHLCHQSIVQVYDFGYEDSIPFMAMEYVDGIDGARLLNHALKHRRPLPVKLSLYIASQMLEALSFAHSRVGDGGAPLGIVHRDVSPSNVLISVNGEVKLADFGIAKGSHRSQLTDAGQMRGKYAYMSPEQAMGMAIDMRSDIFSCGIVLYEMATATRLFSAHTDDEVLKNVARASLDERALTALPNKLRALLMMALDCDRDARYQSAGEMLSDVHRAMADICAYGNAADLSTYLAEIFPSEICRPAPDDGESATRNRGTVPLCAKPPIPRCARVARGLAGRLSGALRPGLRSAALLLISTGIFATHPASGSVSAPAADPVVLPVHVEPSQGVSPPPLPEAPPTYGVIAIDTEPSGARGSISLGERKIEFVTPFARDEIPLDGELKGSLDLSLDGYRSHSEAIAIGPTRNALVREIQLKRRASAQIFVGARPWGLASVKGYVARREAPLSGLRVRPGTHLITVTHPPSGASVSRRVRLDDGEVRRCLADFRGKASMRCM